MEQYLRGEPVSDGGRKRVLFIVIPERGHINPYVGPAQVLIEKLRS